MKDHTHGWKFKLCHLRHVLDIFCPLFDELIDPVQLRPVVILLGRLVTFWVFVAGVVVLLLLWLIFVLRLVIFVISLGGWYPLAFCNSWNANLANNLYTRCYLPDEAWLVFATGITSFIIGFVLCIKANCRLGSSDPQQFAPILC